MNKTAGLTKIGKIWRKATRLSWADRFLLLEALVLLAVVAPAIRLLPFPKIGRMASGPVHEPRLADPDAKVLIERVRWAVEVAAGRARWRAVCFQQGLAAQLMLRRRGVDSTLYFGAAPDKQKGLTAHVWVRVGDTDVIGTETAAGYATLAAFPSTKGAA